jgi:hypothetical protein
MPTKSTFSALGAPMSLAWAHESPCVEGSALPKSVESGKLSLNEVGIGRMSAQINAAEGVFSGGDFTVELPFPFTRISPHYDQQTRR